MAKVVLLLLVFLLAYWIYRTGRNHSQDKAKKREAAATPENIVVCAYCRLHVPESEAIAANGKFFCTDEHRRLGGF